MKQITFRELLNLMYNNKAPIQVKYDGEVYKKFKFYDYRNENRLLLSTAILNKFTLDIMNRCECITICDEILDDKEKEYLKAFIKPFRNRVKTIERIKNKEWELIRVFYKDYDDTSDNVRSFISLPMFEAGTMYRGMELNKEYTLEELGL